LPFQNKKGRENLVKKNLTILLTLTLVGTVSFIVYFSLTPSKTQEKELIIGEKSVENKEELVEEIKPPEYFCPVCGEKTTEEDSKLRPLAIIIENHPAARPQSGLEDACIVYETLAEGGITRFLAIYTHKDCKNIGPVRSVREYFASIAKGYDAILAHCGGSPTGYSTVKELHVAALDEFANSGAYWRAKNRNRPHNLYTSTENLRKRAAQKKFDSEANFESFKFKDDISIQERPDETYVEIDFSSPKFKAKYEYDKGKNSYVRFMGGLPHKDSNSGEQLQVKNILVQITSIQIVDKIGRVKIGTVGNGTAYAFLDGKATKGKWVRENSTSTIKFYDEFGKEIKLNRGQTWIEIIPPNRKVNFPKI